MTLLQTVRHKFRRHKVVTEQQQPQYPDWHWTKDQYILEQYFHQLMFIPDDMMVGARNQGILKDISCKVMNPIVYTHNKFLAYQMEIGKTEKDEPIYRPIILPSEYTPSNFLRPEI